jgi:hypothetical protein
MSFHAFPCLGLVMSRSRSRSIPFLSFRCTKLSIMCEILRVRERNT